MCVEVVVCYFHIELNFSVFILVLIGVQIYVMKRRLSRGEVIFFGKFKNEVNEVRGLWGNSLSY